MKKREAKQLAKELIRRLFANETEVETVERCQYISFGHGVMLRERYVGWQLEVDQCEVRLPRFTQRRLNCAVNRYLVVRAKSRLGSEH